MGGRQQWVYRTGPSRFPKDFPQRLDSLREAAGLSWRGLARMLRVDVRALRRWRDGVRPDAGHLYALLQLADEMGLLGYLLTGSVGLQDPLTRGACDPQAPTRPETPRTLATRV